MNPQPKQQRFKSEKYLKWVRSQPCCVCGKPADHAHHIIGVGGMSGMGLKAQDWATVPVCAEHHRLIHLFPDMQGDQWEWIARTLGRAIEEGIIKI